MFRKNSPYIQCHKIEIKVKILDCSVFLQTWENYGVYDRQFLFLLYFPFKVIRLKFLCLKKTDRKKLPYNKSKWRREIYKNELFN